MDLFKSLLHACMHACISSGAFCIPWKQQWKTFKHVCIACCLCLRTTFLFFTFISDRIFPLGNWFPIVPTVIYERMAPADGCCVSSPSSVSQFSLFVCCVPPRECYRRLWNFYFCKSDHWYKALSLYLVWIMNIHTRACLSPHLEISVSVF